MTRLQKKCLIAAAGTHLLVVVAVLCSGFITSKPKPDDSQLLDVIPATAIDAALQSGVKDAQPPPPTPVVQPQVPTPAPPTPPTPPQPKPAEPVTPPEKIQPADLTPVDHSEPKPKPVKPHEVQPDFTPIVRSQTDQAEADAAAAKERRLRDAKLKAFREAERAIEKNSSSSTKIDMPGNSSAAYADYASIVKSVYTQAWTPPDDAANDSANAKARITIANDGRVISATMITPSGDASVDRTVQNTLDRVQQIEPFPDGATDTERSYIINFNLKARRQML
jgi:protein TonB